ncbi:hypothetical protein AZE42_07261 [Rhizopogon vesiculosus]|uniref:Uncharacterized protein n=1 Tax=Rhizopogon vesiculosus TaxID=180088 RepID=A0A1J8QXR6_9AGAM|nr:hypothetical protein AZE42_07261 [Rhizopogon vesiculosus]
MLRFTLRAVPINIMIPSYPKDRMALKVMVCDMINTMMFADIG